MFDTTFFISFYDIAHYVDIILYVCTLFRLQRTVEIVKKAPECEIDGDLVILDGAVMLLWMIPREERFGFSLLTQALYDITVPGHP